MEVIVRQVNHNLLMLLLLLLLFVVVIIANLDICYLWGLILDIAIAIDIHIGNNVYSHPVLELKWIGFGLEKSEEIVTVLVSCQLRNGDVVHKQFIVLIWGQNGVIIPRQEGDLYTHLIIFIIFIS